MKGRVALVTGGSRGIGRAVVERLQADGADVMAPTRDELDLSDPVAVEDYAAGLTGAVDILVNNAGVNPLAGYADLRDEDLDATLAVDLLAPLRLCRALAPGMAARGYGRIVNITSVWAVVARQQRLPYIVAKSGLTGLTRALAVELASAGVLVNAVAPGFIATELTAQNNTSEEIAAVLDRVPVGRLGQPAEVAEVVRFLCSSVNSFMTGQVLVCDGGYTCQ